MRIIDSLDEMTETARGWLAGGRVGFVLITNTIHEGHQVLIHTARELCEILVVCMIKKTLLPETDEVLFDPDREIMPDLQLLSGHKIDILFMPREEELYPSTFSTHITPGGPLAMCQRPGIPHGRLRLFATTITKLFQLIRPDVTFFGQKDAFQVALIRQLIRDLNIDMTLHVLPTIRESDGLAMSSRNRLLTPQARLAVPVLHRGLLKARTLIEGGERRAASITQMITQHFSTPHIQLDHVTICHPETFIDVPQIHPGTLIALQVHANAIPLSDNIHWLPNGQWRI